MKNIHRVNKSAYFKGLNHDEAVSNRYTTFFNSN